LKVVSGIGFFLSELGPDPSNVAAADFMPPLDDIEGGLSQIAILSESRNLQLLELGCRIHKT
jgi:hypothetical protein